MDRNRLHRDRLCIHKCEWERSVAHLTSSTLSAVSYSDDPPTLELEFRSGSVYRYFDVPRKIHHALLAAESKGTFFNTNIRNRFRYEEISH